MKKLGIIVLAALMLLTSCGKEETKHEVPNIPTPAKTATVAKEEPKQDLAETVAHAPAEAKNEWTYWKSASDYEAETGKKLTYSEAPELATLVEEGKLPAVEERVGLQPMVIDPIEEIGTYGGKIRAGATGPTTEGWDFNTFVYQQLFTLGANGNSVIPNVVRDFSFSNNTKTLTLYLREGMKWSDGELFTADDFIFWYNAVYCDRDVLPIPDPVLTPGGELFQMSKIDDYTVQIDFAVPAPFFIGNIALSFKHLGFFAPKHYLAQYHIKYNDKAEDLAAAEGMLDWMECFNAHYTMEMLGQEQKYIERPTINPWILSSIDKLGNRFYVRNPYYWKVDTQGQQLPYISTADRIVVQYQDVKKMMVMNGELDIASKDLALTDFPIYKKGEKAGNYTSFLADGTKGAYLVFGFNLTYKGDDQLVSVMSDVRFRQACSLAFNRDELNQMVFMGLGIPRQLAPIPSTSYHEDWMEDYYAAYDVAQANQLLDEMGLKWDEKHEYRTYADGKTISIPLEYWRWSADVSNTVELLVEYWKAIGLKLNAKELEPSLFFEKRLNNELPIVTWGGDNQTELLLYVNSEWSRPPYFAWIDRCWYFWLNGKDSPEAVEPPQDIKDLWDWNIKRMQTELGSDEYMKLSKMIAEKNVTDLYQIGTVGLIPNPVCLNANFVNEPSKGSCATDNVFFRPYAVETWFYQN